MTLHIMVVGDDATKLERLHDILLDRGDEVLTRSRQALDMADLAQRKPDLVIVDWPAGHEDHGWQTCKWVKYHPATAHIPLLVCAAPTPLLVEMEGLLRAQGVVVVYQPFTRAELDAGITVATVPEEALKAFALGADVPA